METHYYLPFATHPQPHRISPTASHTKQKHHLNPTQRTLPHYNTHQSTSLHDTPLTPITLLKPPTCYPSSLLNLLIVKPPYCQVKSPIRICLVKNLNTFRKIKGWGKSEIENLGKRGEGVEDFYLCIYIL